MKLVALTNFDEGQYFFVYGNTILDGTSLPKKLIHGKTNRYIYIGETIEYEVNRKTKDLISLSPAEAVLDELKR